MTRLRDVSAASTRCAWLVYPTETLPQRLKSRRVYQLLRRSKDLLHPATGHKAKQHL